MLLRATESQEALGLLIGLFGALGMALLATLEYPEVRLAGFIAMLAYARGWVWLGLPLWRPTAAG